MRTPSLRQRAPLNQEAALTPMIDVIFQLLIFFLCTAGFGRPEDLLPTPLPKAPPNPKEVAAQPGHPRIARVQLRGRGNHLQVFLNQRRLPNLADLLEKLTALGQISKDLPIILDIAPEVLLADVVSVYDGCLAAGLRRIHFAVDKNRFPQSE